MNDFTKDDLYMLRRAVINLYKIDDKDSIESPLYKKIQSMIDNYCEHESNGIRYAVIKLRSTDERDYEYKCSKCKKVIFQY